MNHWFLVSWFHIIFLYNTLEQFCNFYIVIKNKGLFLCISDQSLLFNRIRDHTCHNIAKDSSIFDLEDDQNSLQHRDTDSIPRIYACATMWHETKDEMMEMIKSLFRMDEDQSARRVAQKWLRKVDPNYYEFESKDSAKLLDMLSTKFRAPKMAKISST